MYAKASQSCNTGLASTPPTETPVATDLRNVVVALRESLGTLRGRIEPALRPSPPSQSGDLRHCGLPPSPLRATARDLWDIVSEIQEMTASVDV